MLYSDCCRWCLTKGRHMENLLLGYTDGSRKSDDVFVVPFKVAHSNCVAALCKLALSFAASCLFWKLKLELKLKFFRFISHTESIIGCLSVSGDTPTQSATETATFFWGWERKKKYIRRKTNTPSQLRSISIVRGHHTHHLRCGCDTERHSEFTLSDCSQMEQQRCVKTFGCSDTICWMSDTVSVAKGFSLYATAE